MSDVEVSFRGTVITWRGPAPYHFVRVPVPEVDDLLEVVRAATYGWGALPATVRVGGTTWTTSLMPRDGGYLVPVKDAVRRAEGLAEGDEVAMTVTVALRR